MYDNEFETKENKIWTKDKIEPQQIHFSCIDRFLNATSLTGFLSTAKKKQKNIRAWLLDVE